jgi:glycine/D-amino acid oxidase-like deaminating enzyme
MVLVTSRMPHRIYRKVYDADYVGAVGSGDAQLQTSAVVESTASGTVLIGSSRQQIGFDARLQVPVLRAVAARALALFPFLAGMSVMRAYGGFRPFMPDHLPVIGPDPRLPGLWHATGHEGAGIGLSLATGELLRDLMSGSRPAVDPAAFAVDRPSLAAHLREVVPA